MMPGDSVTRISEKKTFIMWHMFHGYEKTLYYQLRRDFDINLMVGLQYRASSTQCEKVER